MARQLTGRSRRAEQLAQALILDRLMFKYQPLIRNEIVAAMRRYGRAYANNDFLAMQAAEIGHIERTTRLLKRLWSESGVLFGRRLLDFSKNGFVKKDYEIPTTQTVDRLVANWALAFGTAKITQITTTTLKDIKSIIELGVIEGLSERDIGRRIESVAPSKGASRAQTIARTETHSASQAVQFEVAEYLDLDLMKVWTAAIDERTRTIADGAHFDHIGADGQKVGLNEPFIIDGIDGSEELMYPGDTSGSAGNVINCRCVMVMELA